MKNPQKKPLVSICIPILNEAENLDPLYEKLNSLTVSFSSQAEFEFLFTDNHSEDKSWQILTEISQKDSRVKAIRFSKNFGFQKSLWANSIYWWCMHLSRFYDFSNLFK